MERATTWNREILARLKTPGASYKSPYLLMFKRGDAWPVFFGPSAANWSVDQSLYEYNRIKSLPGPAICLNHIFAASLVQKLAEALMCPGFH